MLLTFVVVTVGNTAANANVVMTIFFGIKRILTEFFIASSVAKRYRICDSPVSSLSSCLRESSSNWIFFCLFVVDEVPTN